MTYMASLVANVMLVRSEFGINMSELNLGLDCFICHFQCAISAYTLYNHTDVSQNVQVFRYSKSYKRSDVPIRTSVHDVYVFLQTNGRRLGRTIIIKLGFKP